MAIALRATTSGGLTFPTSAASPVTANLPVTTLLNDCIVLTISVKGTYSGFVAISGAGATWQIIDPGYDPDSVIAVGYGCSAGATQITVSGSGGSGGGGSYGIAVFSGVAATTNPIGQTGVLVHDQGQRVGR